MDMTQIILAALGLVTLEGIIQFFFIKVNKKHKEVENIDSQVEVAQHANDLLSKQLERSHETINKQGKAMAEKDGVIEAKNKEIAKLNAEKVALCGSLCVHFGCRCRDPRLGMGPTYYEDHKGDALLGGDHLSIDTLIKLDRANRMRLETDAAAAEEKVKAEADTAPADIIYTTAGQGGCDAPQGH